MKKPIAGAVCLVSCLVGCDSSNLDTLESRLLVANNGISEIIITSPSPVIEVAGSRVLTLMGTVGDGEAEVASSADWTSSNTAAIEVSSAGVVTGITDGSSTITAALGPLTSTIELTASSADISVINVAIDSSAADATIDECSTINFTATGDYSDGETGRPISDIVAWSLSAGDIGVVEDSAVGGLLRSNNAGQGTVSAAAGDFVGTFEVTVSDNVGSIEITGDGSTLSTSNAVQYTATASYLDNTNTVEITDNAAWSLDAGFADVDTDLPGKGVVTATSTGTADLVVMCGGETASLSISSGSATEIESFFLNPASNSTATFSGLETLQIEAFIRFENGNELNVTEDSDWLVVSNSSTINTVSDIEDSRGLVTMREPGTLVVEVRYQDDGDGALQTFSQRFTVTRNAATP